LDIGVLGYIGIVWPKEHSPEVRSFPPGTPCIYSWTTYDSASCLCAWGLYKVGKINHIVMHKHWHLAKTAYSV